MNNPAMRHSGKSSLCPDTSLENGHASSGKIREGSILLCGYIRAIWLTASGPARKISRVGESTNKNAKPFALSYWDIKTQFFQYPAVFEEPTKTTSKYMRCFALAIIC